MYPSHPRWQEEVITGTLYLYTTLFKAQLYCALLVTRVSKIKDYLPDNSNTETQTSSPRLVQRKDSPHQKIGSTIKYHPSNQS